MVTKKKGGKKSPAKKKTTRGEKGGGGGSKPKGKKKTAMKRETHTRKAGKKSTSAKVAPTATGFQETGIKLFKDPMTLTSGELEQRTIALDRGKGQQEAEMACCLYTIEEKQIYVSHGWDRKDYYHERLEISYTKATELARTWELLVGVGVRIKRLVGLTWTKVKIIKKGIVHEKINARNLDIWLGRCIAAPGKGGDFTSLEALENMVKNLIAEADRAAMSEETTLVKFEVMKYEMPLVLQFEDIAKDTLKTDNRGAWFLQALIDFSSNYANLKDRKDAAYWKSRGLAAMKELVERTAPVAALFVPLAEGLTSKKLGVEPTSHVYQGYKDGGSDPLFCAAMSEKEAIQFLGVKHVRSFPILVANSLMPKAQFRVEPEKTTEPAPAKPKKKGKKAKVSSFAGKVKKMNKKEIIVEISRLVNAMGVKERVYMPQKDTIEKDLPEGLNIDQAMLCWLYETEKKRGKKKSTKKAGKKKAAAKKATPKKKSAKKKDKS